MSINECISAIPLSHRRQVLERQSFKRKHQFTWIADVSGQISMVRTGYSSIILPHFLSVSIHTIYSFTLAFASRPSCVSCCVECLTEPIFIITVLLFSICIFCITLKIVIVFLQYLVESTCNHMSESHIVFQRHCLCATLSI